MEVRLSKLSDSEDIEAYLTTCERMMSVYEVPEDQWVFKLAPQLTGKAYAALGAAEAVDYQRVKEAIRAKRDNFERPEKARMRLFESRPGKEVDGRMRDFGRSFGQAGC